MKRKKLFVYGPLLFIILFFIESCGSKNGNDPFSEINFWDEKGMTSRVENYFDNTLGEKANPKSGNPVVYVDFSDGLIQAYTSNPENKSIIQAITNKFVSKDIKWKALGIKTGEITDLEFESNELFNKVTDPNSYVGLMAPIQTALNEITNSKNDALLITDFEEFTPDGVEQMENYAKKYFINWLSKDNSISFFYTNFKEKNKKTKITTDKHLFFTIFTHGKSNENSLITQIVDAFKGRFNPKRFDLTNNPYTLSNEYGGKELTGIGMDLQKQVTSSYNGLNFKKPFEFINIGKYNWEYLDKTIKNPKYKDDIFLSKLFLNTSNESSYKLSKLEVKVYDVTDDYIKYNKCYEAATNFKPVTIKDKNGKNVFDEKACKPIAKLCYDPKTSQLKSEWLYSYNKEITPIDEVFMLNQDLFINNKKDHADKVELQIKMHTNYKLEKIKNPNSLLRLDIVIEDCVFNDSNPQLLDFQWKSCTVKTQPINTSISESIRNTLQDPQVLPKGKVLYSFYIKTLNKK